ncbi:MAG: class F sortase [Acidobacteria bacterium]|nr:class F sortase [Acidobacteriota bacterium]
MTRWLRNPFALAALAIAGVLVSAAGAAVVVPAGAADVVAAEPALEPTAQATTTIAPTTTPTVVETTNTTDTPTTTMAPAATTETPQAAIEAAFDRPPPHRPTTVRIASIGVDATIIDLGLNPDRTLEVPEDIRLTGWWTGRSVPGEEGPSIVVGHIDSAAQGAGVFFRLRELDVGDVIYVERSDGSVAEFRVTETELVLKDEFPTEKVYGSTEGSQLRLITCGGSFDRSARSYLGNLIVYAEHVGTTEAVRLQSSDPISAIS